MRSFSPRNGSTWSTAEPRRDRPRSAALHAHHRVAGLLHDDHGATGLPQRLDATVECAVGAPVSSALPGPSRAPSTQGAGGRAAAVATTFGPDGGYLIAGARCR